MNYYNLFVNVAKGLDGFIVGQKEDVPYDITDLMNGYCKAKDENDEVKINQYASALIVRYWHMVIQLYKTSASTRLDFDEIIGWVYESIEKACKYRSWLDVNKEISKDPKGAEKVLNQCITSTRQYWYKNFNQNKRKINFLISDSLDDNVYCDGKVVGTILDSIEDESSRVLINEGDSIVESYINLHKIFEAIILEVILNYDSFMDINIIKTLSVDVNGNTINVTTHKPEFSLVKCKKVLKNIDALFINNFVNKYDVDKESIIEVVSEIKNFSKAQLTNRVNKAFKIFKKDMEIRELVCQ